MDKIGGTLDIPKSSHFDPSRMRVHFLFKKLGGVIILQYSQKQIKSSLID
jgi:hypothetical protein